MCAYFLSKHGQVKEKREKKRLRDHIDSFATECLFCGSTEKLVFHHVNATEKGREVACAGSVKRINEEVAKCWCLCESCHTKLHQRLCDPLPSTWDTRISVPDTAVRGPGRPRV